MKVVYAKRTAAVAVDERSITVMYGTHWPSEDPVVRKYPDLFSEDPKFGLFASENPYAEGLTSAQ